MDEGNVFGKYFEQLRHQRGATIKELSEGICTASLITRIESGERVSKRDLRNVLLGRLGASFDEFTEYVKNEEYNQVDEKEKILEEIICHNYETAGNKLEVYYQNNKHNNIAVQIYFGCKAMIEKSIGGGKVRFYLERAIEKTINISSDGNIINKFLSPGEINLLTEYALCLEKCKKKELLNYLMSYVNTNKFMPRCLALFFSKLVYYYVSECVDICDRNSACGALQLINRAMECLREAAWSIFAMELLELAEKLLSGILTDKSDNIPLLEKQHLLIKRQIMFWKELSDCFDVSPYTEDWTYIYREQGVRSIGKDMANRRKMLRLSREEIYDNICSSKTLTRIEMLKSNVHGDILRELLSRVFVDPNCSKDFISVKDMETKNAEEEILRDLSLKRYEEGKEKINYILQNEKRLSIWDEQFLRMLDACVEKCLGIIDSEKAIDELNNALLITLDLENIDNGFLCFTNTEQLILYNLILLKDGNVSDKEKKLCTDLFDSLKEISPDNKKGMLELYYLAMMKIEASEEHFDNVLQLYSDLMETELKYKRNYVINDAFLSIQMMMEKVPKESAKVIKTVKQSEHLAYMMHRAGLC